MTTPPPSQTRSPTTEPLHLDLTTNFNDTRFTLELEFITLLSNPYYIYHLATAPASSFPSIPLPYDNAHATDGAQTSHKNTQPVLLLPEFIRYLEYLSYWRKAEYVKFLKYPELSLKHLSLLQHERFRGDVCGSRGWDVVVGLIGVALAGRSGQEAGRMDVVEGEAGRGTKMENEDVVMAGG